MNIPKYKWDLYSETIDGKIKINISCISRKEARRWSRSIKIMGFGNIKKVIAVRYVYYDDMKI